MSPWRGIKSGVVPLLYPLVRGHAGGSCNPELRRIHLPKLFGKSERVSSRVPEDLQEGPKGSRSAASWRQKPTLERPPAIFQTVSPRTPPVNKASLSVGLLPSATNRALVCVAHLHGAAIKANPPKSGDAKPRASNRTEGSRATEHRGQDAFSYLWAAQGGSDHPDDLHRLSDGRTL